MLAGTTQLEATESHAVPGHVREVGVEQFGRPQFEAQQAQAGDGARNPVQAQLAVGEVAGDGLQPGHSPARNGLVSFEQAGDDDVQTDILYSIIAMLHACHRDAVTSLRKERPYTDPRTFRMPPAQPQNAKGPTVMAGPSARIATKIRWLPDQGSNLGPAD